MWGGVDILLFVLVAFYGILPSPLLHSVMVSNYLFKVGLEALGTPVAYKSTDFLKRVEREDFYDYDTDFGPFRLRW